MSRTTSRVLWIIAGVLLIIAGVTCIGSPETALGGLSILLGISMLFSGVVDILIFSVSHNLIYGSGWFLLDGILTVMLSIFLLANKGFTMMSLPYIMGMWLIFTGVGRFVSSFDLKRFGIGGWGWVTAIGVLLAAAGFMSFANPFAGAVVLGTLVSILLILQGAASVIWGIISLRFWM